jgi:acid phosphatase
MDTISATDAHGPATKLPAEFYDPQMRASINKISMEEWYSGYMENREYRMLGIGGLAADIVGRMVQSVEGEKKLRFAMSGCHDTTLAGMLASLGAFAGEKWPPFTSHVAVELFSAKEQPVNKSSGRWFGWLSGSKTAASIGRKPLEELNTAQRASLDGYYVRVRYNDRIIKVPACAAEGKHLAGDDSFCTLVSYPLKKRR